MTRKDYVIIAEALRDADASWAAAKLMADALADDNPRFDRARFLAACGYGA